MPVRNGLKQSSTPAPNLPVVSFRKVIDEGPPQLAGVHDQQARSYGYNDPNVEFKRPEAYIRYIEPLENELANQVEYDMDEQDQEWLDAINTERKKEQANPVTYETFEIILDKIEKEWFELTKKLPKPDTPGPSEDSTCAICDDAEVENSNAIVFCDGCNLAVHQECYGVPYIPEGQWLCRKCQLSPEHPVSCVLCPNEGGAFKQTTTGAWAHLLCAMYIAETSVGNSVIQEPIEGVQRIEKARWKLTCTLCDKGAGYGACIQCAKTLCYVAYHTTCARKYKLLMPMKGAEGEKLQLTSYCPKHIPPEQCAAHLAAVRAERERDGSSDAESDADSMLRSGRTAAANTAGALDTPKTKSARAYAKSYSLGAPLVPAKIVDNVMFYIGKISVHKKLAFVQMVCRYWSLKREARRGAPLLKRLHLEPWTGGGADQRLTSEQKAEKLKLVVALRKDLETVRMIAEITRKREIEKLKQAQIVQELLSSILYPHETTLRGAFERIVTLDRHDVFKLPVSRTEVPDYFDVVKEPMCWNQIDSKLDKHEYWDLGALKHDILLVLDNALLYNNKDTTIHRLATRMRPQVSTILDQLDHLVTHSSEGVGNLEPSLELLELLLSHEKIEDKNPFVLNVQPIESLFNYEFGTLKPPPPKLKYQRPPKKQKKERPPRDYAAERARKRNRGGTFRELAALDSPPEFRARTRGEAAKHAAFVAEAGVGREAIGTSDTSLKPKDNAAAPSQSQTVNIKKRQRRDGALPPINTADPQLAETIDTQQSFKMFDEGWILPPTARRGNRAPVDRPDVPVPKKKRRIDQTAPPSAESGHETALTSTSKPNTRGNRINNGRFQNIKVSVAPQAPTESRSHLPPDSDLSDLSDLSSEGEEDRSSRSSALPQELDPEAEAVRHLKLSTGQHLESGTLVWAKMESYPSWPAVVYDDDLPTVPKQVLATRQVVVRKEPGPLHLVQFYDSSRSWQWLEPSKLHLLGEDDEFDASMVTGKSAFQRFRNNHLRSECRAAYRRAKAEMETEDDILNPPPSEGETGTSVDPENEDEDLDTEVLTELPEDGDTDTDLPEETMDVDSGDL